MGAWGTGIFDSDTAADVRVDYADALASGLDRAGATRTVLAAYEPLLGDHDEGSVIWIALAAAQLEDGIVEPIVREHVFAALNENQDRWREDDLADETDINDRAAALAELRARLLASLSA